MEEEQDITQEEAVSLKVFSAIGEASMCWTETPKGVFDSTRAKRIGDDLIKLMSGACMPSTVLRTTLTMAVERPSISGGDRSPFAKPRK